MIYLEMLESGYDYLPQRATTLILTSLQCTVVRRNCWSHRRTSITSHRSLASYSSRIAICGDPICIQRPISGVRVGIFR